MNTQETFYGLGIAPLLLKQLEILRFTIPTPIQHKAIPIAIAGDDLVGIAQTGTGKTLAFAIPMIQRLALNKNDRGLVLVPTRELALQVDQDLRQIGRLSSLKTAVLIGGTPLYPQIQAIRANPQIIVATPGRLIDHLKQKTISLINVRILVLDEADRMLDIGFEPQIKAILAQAPRERQTMLFSATMPVKVANIAKTYMKKPLHVEIAPSGTAPERVDQEVFIVPQSQKINLLAQLFLEYRGPVLVFCRTKYGAKRIAKMVRDMGYSSSEIHSNRSLNQRTDALNGFKSGRYRILVATDIAARGIDVKGIELVINYDLPENSEDYVHRIGRTARAGRAGKAISFAAPEQKRDIQSIERLIRSRLPIKPLPKLSAHSSKSRAYAYGN